jgi:uncharacterized protein (TIGR01319 family)
MTDVLCLDVGSTFTKGVLVGADGAVLGTAETPTTLGGDVLDRCQTLVDRLGAQDAATLACSSAGGGLRLAVVGYERQVTAEAGYRVGLSAGAKVVHVASERLDRAAVRELGRAEPDVVLLVGGTDGGNADVLRHNGAQLAEARLGVPIVVAGNVDAQDEVAHGLRGAGQPVSVADNVVPEIGVIQPASARAAIRATFLDHVIGGKGLSSRAAFREMVRAPTPDAMLRGVEVMAAALGADLSSSTSAAPPRTSTQSSRPRARTRPCARRSSARSGAPAPSRATWGFAGTPSASWRRPPANASRSARRSTGM